MLAIVAKTIARFKLTWGQELEDEAILGTMREAGHTWGTELPVDDGAPVFDADFVWECGVRFCAATGG
jgi:hypothetical protein